VEQGSADGQTEVREDLRAAFFADSDALEAEDVEVGVRRDRAIAS
jgi:hypothetical protein